jgi:hypothetical protein
MAKDPALLFYTSDFYIGTMGMTDEQVGRYIRLLCLHHQIGRLSEFVMRNTMAGELDPGVIAKFKVDDDGNYYNERLELEADKRKNFTESRLQNLQGAKKEPEKKKTPHMGAHIEGHMVNVNKDVNKDGNEGKPVKKNPKVDEQAFNAFWQAYPNKKAKPAALKAFTKLKPNAELLAEMLKAITAQKQSPQWQKDNGQYIPMPSTWLNQERWDDEVSITAESESVNWAVSE